MRAEFRRAERDEGLSLPELRFLINEKLESLNSWASRWCTRWSTLCLLVVGVYQQGWKKTRASYVPAEPAKGNVSAAELSESRSGRRVMAFALPVALATWSVLVMFRDQW